MTYSQNKFYLDKQNGKLSGVCSGLADYTGWDVTWIRLGAFFLILLTFPWMLIAYGVTAWIAHPKPAN